MRASIVDDRIDVIWDQSELDERLDAFWLRDASASDGQLKLEPQPQVRLALGLLIENPAWLRPSL